MGFDARRSFPELKNKMDAEFAKITLQELLSHSSGLSDGSEIFDLIIHSYMQDGNLDEIRYWMVKEIAPKPLDHVRGSKFAYSDVIPSRALSWNAPAGRPGRNWSMSESSGRWI